VRAKFKIADVGVTVGTVRASRPAAVVFLTIAAVINAVVDITLASLARSACVSTGSVTCAFNAVAEVRA
jgi:hypothetical protein